MTDVVLERLLPADCDRVFEFVSRHENLLSWWAPEGSTIPDETLDFTRRGPWHSVFINADGRRYKVSGQVTRVEKPNLVAFTWGWHDADDVRGRETHVMIELIPEGPAQTRLVLRHADLPDEDGRQAHARGWTSSLGKLETALAA
jgi:uncharacterized protein YndB with AHSA1/START domain